MRSGFGIAEDAAGDEFHRPQISLWRECNTAIVSHATGQDSSSPLPRFSLGWLHRGWGISLRNQFFPGGPLASSGPFCFQTANASIAHLSSTFAFRRFCGWHRGAVAVPL